MNEIERKAERRKLRAKNRARKKALKFEKAKAKKERKRQERESERERQLKMDRLYTIATINNDLKTQKKLLDSGYKIKGGLKSRSGGVSKCKCSNPKPYQGGAFTPK